MVESLPKPAEKPLGGRSSRPEPGGRLVGSRVAVGRHGPAAGRPPATL